MFLSSLPNGVYLKRKEFSFFGKNIFIKGCHFSEIHFAFLYTISLWKSKVNLSKVTTLYKDSAKSTKFVLKNWSLIQAVVNKGKRLQQIYFIWFHSPKYGKAVTLVLMLTATSTFVFPKVFGMLDRNKLRQAILAGYRSCSRFWQAILASKWSCS